MLASPRPVCNDVLVRWGVNDGFESPVSGKAKGTEENRANILV